MCARDDVHYSLVTAQKTSGDPYAYTQWWGGGGGEGMNEIKEKSDHAPTVTART